MAKRLIEKALEELTADELKRFKRQLSEAALECGYDAIPFGRLQKADPMDVADIIVRFYRTDYGIRVTARTLQEINQKPLGEKLLKDAEAGGASGSPVPARTKSETEASAGPPPAESHFVDWRREEIIARTSLVAPILDVLLQKKLLTPEQYETILVKDTTQKRMRELYRFAIGWGRAGKDQLYEALKTHNGPLISDLGGL